MVSLTLLLLIPLLSSPAPPTNGTYAGHVCVCITLVCLPIEFSEFVGRHTAKDCLYSDKVNLLGIPSIVILSYVCR